MNSVESKDLIEKIISSNCLSTVFQPIFVTKDMYIHGAEALSRIHSQGIYKGTIADLFTTAYSCGMLSELDAYCRFIALKTWSQFRPRGVFLFLNCDSRSLESFDDLILALQLKQFRIPNRNIVLEVTESALDIEVLRNFSNKCKYHGWQIALDDMNDDDLLLSRVTSIVPKYIKIDKASIVGITTNRNKRESLQRVVSFAAAIDSLVIVEGGESQRELATVRSSGVTLCQNYIYGKPMRIEELCSRISSWKD